MYITSLVQFKKNKKEEGSVGEEKESGMRESIFFKISVWYESKKLKHQRSFCLPEHLKDHRDRWTLESNANMDTS